jgi:hypothetical protein
VVALFSEVAKGDEGKMGKMGRTGGIGRDRVRPRDDDDAKPSEPENTMEFPCSVETENAS